MNAQQKILVCLLLFSMQVKGQQSDMGLNVGDSLPIFRISKIINAKSRSGSTSDYRSKLLIIDFWSVGCASCIEALPKMEALEKKFEPLVRILPVTYNEESKVIEFSKYNFYTKQLKGSSVVDDKMFHKYFKHRDIPHEVWVYKGKVVAITGIEYVDEYNIKRVLNNEKIDWPLKNDFYIPSTKKPLFTVDTNKIKSPSKIIRYAAISDFKQRNNSTLSTSGGSGIVRDSSSQTVRSFFLNQAILTSYLTLWLKIIGVDFQKFIRPSLTLQPNQIVWDVRDRNVYTFEKKAGNYLPEWMNRNAICFESVNVDTGQTDRDVYLSMIGDLDRLLDLNVKWEKQWEKVFVIKKKSHGANNKIDSSPGSNLYSMFEICENFNAQASNPYLFNETGDNRTKIRLASISWTDTARIIKGIKAAGFYVSLENRAVDKLIFKEINNGRMVDSDMQSEMKLKILAQKQLKDPSEEENAIYLQRNKDNLDVIQTNSGLQYKILKKGSGRTPKRDSKVLVHFEGKLVNGKIFQSTYERGIPLEIKVVDMIKGLSEAILLMQEGSQWEIYIPSSLAYGAHTGHGKFPPNSTLIFTLQLLNVKY